MATDLSALDDAAISKMLAQESVRGPRIFRGKPLAPLTLGIRSIFGKVARPGDLVSYCDWMLIYLLTEAHGETDADRLANRKLLLSATDDADEFRGRISLSMDDLTPAEMTECGAIVDELHALADAATALSAEQKKSMAVASSEAKQPPTPTPLPSKRSRKPTTGRGTKSSGSGQK